MNRTLPIALSLGLIASFAWAEDDAQSSQQQQQSQQAEPQSDAAASSDASATASDDQAQAAASRQGGQQDPAQMFITDMYSHNLYEVQLATLAQKQAQDQQIKQLAQMLIKDHTMANQQLKQLAQSAGVQVQEKLDPVHQAKLQKFQQLPQTEFSRKFANDQVAGHMMAVLELQYQSQNAQNAQVKQFATKMLPQMKQHLQHATQIATQQAGGSAAGGQAQPASERQPAESSQDPSGQSGSSGQSEESGQSTGTQQQ